MIRPLPGDRPPAVAGTWYPGDRAALEKSLDAQLADASAGGEGGAHDAAPVALIAPHAGLVYSGRVAAAAYRLLPVNELDIAVIVGPAHYVDFEGVSVWPRGRFLTPLGALTIDETLAEELIADCGVVHDRRAAHAREHSIEMQLPFLAHLVPDCPILPLVMGRQTRETAMALGASLSRVVGSRRAILVASSDLSHFFEAPTARSLDAAVIREIERFDADGLMALLERREDHACGGGPMVSVIAAARALGATRSEILRYADSGDVSGDKSSVVGYVSAALWR